MPALELARTRPKTVELLLRSARLPAAARGLLCSHATAFINGSCAPHNNTLTNSITRTRYTDLYLDPLPIRLVLSHITSPLNHSLLCLQYNCASVRLISSKYQVNILQHPDWSVTCKWHRILRSRSRSRSCPAVVLITATSWRFSRCHVLISRQLRFQQSLL